MYMDILYNVEFINGKLETNSINEIVGLERDLSG